MSVYVFVFVFFFQTNVFDISFTKATRRVLRPVYKLGNGTILPYRRDETVETVELVK